MPLRLFSRSHSQSQVEPEPIHLKAYSSEPSMMSPPDRSESETTLHFAPHHEIMKPMHASLWHTHQAQSNVSEATAVLAAEHALAASVESLHLGPGPAPALSGLPKHKSSPALPLVAAKYSAALSAVPASASAPLAGPEKRSLLFRLLKKELSAPKKPTKPEVPRVPLTAEQKQQLALAERAHRLKEVINVLENRRSMPKGIEHIVFKNFLGDGTYGFVLTAFLGEREVAVKFIFKDKVPPTAWMCEEDQRPLPSEVYFLKRLHHPNLISYLGCYEDPQYFILLTELHGASWDAENPKLKDKHLEGFKTVSRAKRAGSDGKGDLNTLSSLNAKQRQLLRPRVSCDLFECIDAHDFFPERVVRHIFRQIAEAVNYLHQNGIVHRDLKDENVVIDENYTVKLIDFGSAAYIPSTSSPLFDKFLGTMDFAAPEIIEGFRYRGVEVEVWALGVLLYILVFRQVPFKTPRDIVDVRMHLPAELTNVYDGASDLYDLLSLILQKNPDARPTVFQILLHPWLTNDLEGF